MTNHDQTMTSGTKKELSRKALGTVDMTKMAGTTTAKWFDPTSAVYTTISTNLANSGTHNFTPSGNNSGGDGDWMLVLTSSNPAPDTNPVVRISFP